MARRRRDRSDVASAVRDEAELMRRARLMLMAVLSTVDGSPLWAVRRELERVLQIGSPPSDRPLAPLADRVWAAEALIERHGLADRVERQLRSLERS